MKGTRLRVLLGLEAVLLCVCAVGLFFCSSYYNVGSSLWRNARWHLFGESDQIPVKIGFGDKGSLAAEDLGVSVSAITEIFLSEGIRDADWIQRVRKVVEERAAGQQGRLFEETLDSWVKAEARAIKFVLTQMAGDPFRLAVLGPPTSVYFVGCISPRGSSLEALAIRLGAPEAWPSSCGAVIRLQTWLFLLTVFGIAATLMYADVADYYRKRQHQRGESAPTGRR